MVERIFAEITERQVKRGVHRGERGLTEAMLNYTEIRNQYPKPFTWVPTADQILNAVKMFCIKSETLNNDAYL